VFIHPQVAGKPSFHSKRWMTFISTGRCTPRLRRRWSDSRPASRFRCCMYCRGCRVSTHRRFGPLRDSMSGHGRDGRS